MKTGILLIAALLLASPLASATERNQSDGYALLFDLTEKERHANLIFVVKDASDGVQAATKKIAKLYGRIGDELKEWADDDKSIQLKATHLPSFEAETREWIDHAHTKQLMEDVKGKSFEKLFMTLQWQSLWYSHALVRNLIDNEQVPARKKALRDADQELRSLIDEVYAKT